MNEAQNHEYRENTGHVTEVRGPAVVAVREDVDTNFANDHEYGPLQLNNQGRLKVDAAQTTQTLSEWFEDSPHTTGDTGVFILTVRNDTNAVLTSNDGDYSPIAVNAAGAFL